jgi:hypothetical protein
MGSKPQKKKPEDLQVIDIRLLDLSAVPPRYFFTSEIANAVYHRIRDDVLINGAKIPAGCEPVYGSKMDRKVRQVAAFTQTKHLRILKYIFVALVFLVASLIINTKVWK